MKAEDSLQITVAEYLDRVLPAQAVWFHVPNGGARNKAEAAKFKRMGVKAGIPDVCILWCGRLYTVELKAPGRSLSKAQKKMLPALEAAGARTCVCKSLHEVEAFLKQFIPLKAKVA